MIDLTQSYIVASLQEKDLEKCLNLAREAKAAGATALEYCADLIGGSTDAHEASLVQLVKEVALPVVLRIRHLNEGGQFDKSEMERLELFHSLIPFVDMVDIELTSYDKSHDIRSLVIDLAHGAGKQALVSIHDFKKTPRFEEMENYTIVAKDLHADLVKMAFAPQSKEEVLRLSSFTLRNKYFPVATISMGELGIPSRFLNPALGSVLTYGYVGEKITAPGQMPIKLLAEAVENVGGPIKKTPVWIKKFLENVWNGMDLNPGSQI